MSHQWTMEDFESIYSRFKSSGLSVMDFCSNECIRPKRFYEWRSKLLRKGGFIPVKVNSKGQVSLPHKEKSLLSAPPVSPSPIPQPLCVIFLSQWRHSPLEQPFVTGGIANPDIFEFKPLAYVFFE